MNVALEIAFGLLGGLGLFLFGMKLLTEGLQKAAGNKLKTMLENFTNRPIKGVLVGAFITSIVQSSSITTVTIVGLINAGLMNLTQAISVIMGANIGTTVTAQLVAFNIGKYALPIIALGTALMFFAKKKKYYYYAQIFLGFGILFLGMNFMKQGASPLQDYPLFINALASFGEVVILGILAGAIFTEIIQSSTATTGIVLALAMENVIGLKAAIAIVIGANIGTTISAILASIGTSLSAKRAAMAHVMFNVIGAIVFLPLINVLIYLVTNISGDLPRQIANAHTIFNITMTFVMIPFIPLLAKICKKFIPGKEIRMESGSKYLDKRLLNTPAVAIGQALKELERMAILTIDTLEKSVQAFLHGEKKNIHLIEKKEEVIDSIHKDLHYYLRKIQNEKTLTKKDSKKAASILHTTHDIERVGDHATNLLELAEKKISRKIKFSKQAQEELKLVSEEAIQSYKLAIGAVYRNNKRMAIDATKLEDRIDGHLERFELHHIDRVKKKIDHASSDILFIGALKNLERVSDHANNIAKTVILEGLKGKTK